MKRVLFQRMFLVGLIAIVLTAGCHRADDVEANTPNFFIQKSETLVVPAAVELPANLPGGNTRVATFYAVGVQKYKARVVPGGGPEEYDWVFVAPRADLYDASNRKVGTHGAGPHWKLLAGDSIRGEAFSPARTAPSNDAANIDWLLLKPLTASTPTGTFSNVSYIQRIATYGGKAPAARPLHATDTIDCAYTAIYRFSRKNP